MGEPLIDVVGGGFSGMAAAWCLQKAGARVRLFEKEPRLGGLISTYYTPHGLVERAANGILCSQQVEALFAELDLKIYPSFRKYPRRYIYRKGARSVPLRGLEWLRVPKLLRERIRNFSGLRPEPEESLEKWSLRHWGKGVTDHIVEPAFRGVFAKESSELSATLVLKGLSAPLPRAKRPKGTIAPLRGMGELIDCWTVGLLKLGVEIQLNSRWSDDGRADKVVLCLPPSECAGYLQGDEDSDFLADLKSLPRTGLVTLTAFFDPSSEDLRGFGVLSPVKGALGAMGVLFNSDIFWERPEPLRSETYIFAQEWAQKSDDDILGQAIRDRRLFQKSGGEPRAHYIARRERALPLYGVRLEKFLASHKLSRGRYQLFGNSFGELGLARILEAAATRAPQWMVRGKNE